MSTLTWDQPGERFYETGLDRGVLYPEVGPGVPWNGLVSMTDKAAGGITQSYYFDGIKYIGISESEDFQASLEAFTYPDEFEECIGTSFLGPGLFATKQPKKTFGLSYRTRIGNDVYATSRGYKLHIVYTAIADSTDKSYATLSASPETTNLTWDISATPINTPGAKPTAHFIVDTKTSASEFIDALEDILYGSENSDPRLPTPAELVELSLSLGGLIVFDLGDGTWRAIGSPEHLSYLGLVTFRIEAASVDDLGDGTFIVGTFYEVPDVDDSVVDGGSPPPTPPGDVIDGGAP